MKFKNFKNICINFFHKKDEKIKNQQNIVPNHEDISQKK